MFSKVQKPFLKMSANATCPFCRVHDYSDCFNTSLKLMFWIVSAKTRNIVSWTVWYQQRLKDVSLKHVNTSLCFSLKLKLSVKGHSGLITLQKQNFNWFFRLLNLSNVNSAYFIYYFNYNGRNASPQMILCFETIFTKNETFNIPANIHEMPPINCKLLILCS